MEMYSRRDAIRLMGLSLASAPELLEQLSSIELLEDTIRYGFVSYNDAVPDDIRWPPIDEFYQSGTLLRYQTIVGHPYMVRVKHDSWHHRPKVDRTHGKINFPRRFLRPTSPRDLTPISPNIPPEDKRIVVNLSSQTLTAYEHGEPALHTIISSGRNSLTPRGDFRIYRRQIARYMQPKKEYTWQNWDHPGVPWVLSFGPEAEALHGAFWHNSFGTPVSSGCVNLKEPDARFLWRWTTPFQTDFQVEARKTLPEEQIAVVVL